jgi:hypothetical protein
MMDIETKCEIIEEFIREISGKEEIVENEDYLNWRFYNDLGVPIAQGCIYGLLELTEEGEEIIEETWKSFCELLGVAPDGLYESIYDIVGDLERDE